MIQATTEHDGAEAGEQTLPHSPADNIEVLDVVSVGTTQSAQRPPTKTPAFQAMHATRYRRQELINEIQNKTGRKMICYLGGLQAEISRDDALFLVDLLHNITPNDDLDFVLHTPGGDIDAAEKLITMVRNKVGTGILRVIIPDFAKSAGTLIALGADFIVMSDSSELGPIDPQMVMADENGNRINVPILSYLGAYKEHSAALKLNPNDAVAQMMLSKLDPTRVKHFETALRRARTIAENQLQKGMFRSEQGNFTAIAAKLLDPDRWLSHGQMISAADAFDIGLAVEILPTNGELWQLYWQLHCYQRLDLMERNKLFESSFASLSCESTC